MNTCPVYRWSGGLSYGSTYMGPIGIIMMPTFDARKYSELPFASTLNGSCSNVCPVKIDIHEQIYGWREVMEEKGQIQTVKKQAMKVADKVLSNPTLYQIATTSVSTTLDVLPHFAIYNKLNAWGNTATFPKLPRRPFMSGTRIIGSKGMRCSGYE
jgi:L-lactate dehydrogenase complex protein LldF